MKRILHILSLLILMPLFSSCLEKDWQTPADFDFTLETEHSCTQGAPLKCTVRTVNASPQTGYRFSLLLDGKTIAEDLPLNMQYDSSYVFYICDNDLHSEGNTFKVPAMSLNDHVVGVELKYNKAKLREARFTYYKDAEAIAGLKDSYSAICTEKISISPSMDPKENSDTLRCKLENCEGDQIILDQKEGTWTAYTQNSLPSTGTLLFSTHKESKKVQLIFDIIHIEKVEGIKAEYNALITESINITPVIAPATAMEKLKCSVVESSGDLVKFSEKNGTYTFYPQDGKKCQAKVKFSTDKAGETTVVLTFDISYIEKMEGIKAEYRAQKSESISITPATTPSDAMEHVQCSILDSAGDILQITEDKGCFTFHPKDGKQCQARVKFSTAKAGEAITTLTFYTPITDIDLASSYECVRTEELEIRTSQNILPLTSEELVSCTLKESKGDELIITNKGKGIFSFKAQNSLPSKHTVIFETSACKKEVAITFYHNLEIRMDEGTDREADIILSYSELPAGFQLQPQFTLGYWNKTGKITAGRYTKITTSIPGEKTVNFTQESDNTAISFVREGKKMEYVHTLLGNVWAEISLDQGSKPDYPSYYNYTPVEHVIFLNETSGCYKVSFTRGTVGLDLSVYEMTVEIISGTRYYLPVKTSAFNYCAPAFGDKEECLKEHTIEWWASNTQRIIF